VANVGNYMQFFTCGKVLVQYHNTTQHNTTQHNTTQHNTTQHQHTYRFKEPNIMLIGLWVGSGHPNMRKFLQPAVQQLCALEKGVQIHNEHKQLKITRMVILAMVLDLMGKVFTHNAHLCMKTYINTYLMF
jgi:hypothetical protein